MRILNYLLIAVLLLSGCGSVFGQDYSKKSVKELLPLAEQGDSEAQFYLGVAYNNGRGVRKNQQKAFWWWRVAAAQGHARSQSVLGAMYGLGQGVPKDYVLAYNWLNLSAAQGEKDAAEARDDIAKRMTPSQIQEAQTLAREFKPKKEKPKK